MKGDFSRMTFERARHYSGVRMQQGRVQLDADWNEQLDIQDHLGQTARRDVIGVSGVPLGVDGSSGKDFSIAVVQGKLLGRKGRCYVGGVLCENEEDVDLTAQPDLPGFTLPTTPGRYLVYLDVWPRLLTAVEEPQLREVALNGPDTAVRTRTVSQMKLLPLRGDEDFGAFGVTWIPSGLTSTGKLQARAVPPLASQDACLVPASAGYRRLENHLYRVEIHDESAASSGQGIADASGATFKWSRDNGTLFTRVKRITDKVFILVEDSGRDPLRRFQPGQWVELTDEQRVLSGRAGVLVQLKDVRGDELQVESWPGSEEPQLGLNPTVRGWDGKGTVTPGKFLELEDGVEVAFDSGSYRTGDYWMIPARTATGGVLWPQTGSPPQPVAQGRHGVEHRYCALAVVQRKADGSWEAERDCRRFFAPLTAQRLLLYAGGDGQEAQPGLTVPSPLAASVVIGQVPVEGAQVRFELVTGDTEASAALMGKDARAQTGASVIVLTDAQGVARCDWRLDVNNPVQRARATLLKDDGSPLGVPAVLYTARQARDAVLSEIHVTGIGAGVASDPFPLQNDVSLTPDRLWNGVHLKLDDEVVEVDSMPPSLTQLPGALLSVVASRLADPQASVGSSGKKLGLAPPLETLLPQNPFFDDPGFIDYFNDDTPPPEPPGAWLELSPPKLANSRSATFTIGTNATSASFSYSLDGAGFASCARSFTLNSLSEGPHSLRVQARSAGVSSFSDVFSWTIDVTPPSVGIVSKPANPTNLTSATFTFSSNDSSATFECSLDNGAFTTRSSPATYSLPSDGSHTFQVRARDIAGNVSSPVSHTWVIDATAPSVTIDEKPLNPSGSSSASFKFSSNDSSATFEYKLDNWDFTACNPAMTFSGLSDGDHTVQVRARDSLGNTSPAASHIWRIDTRKPIVNISQKPADPSNITNPIFSFSSDEPSVTFECGIDGRFDVRTSPVSFENLTQGPHVFQVRARDAAGNLSETVFHSWRIDLAVPDVAINVKPPSQTNSRNADFTFSSNTQNVTFETSLDTGAFGASASSTSFPGLAPGSHTLRVRARSVAGNVSAEASHTWVIDVVAPVVSINSSPPNLSNSTSATFTFSSNEVGSTFEGSLDGVAFSDVSSPATFTNLTQGPHTFQVRTRDPAGNVSSALSYSWAVDLTAPELVLSSKPLNPTNSQTATFTFSSSTAGATFECSLDGKAFEPRTSPVIYTGLTEAGHTFQVRARSTAGNFSNPITYNWTVDVTPPDVSIVSKPPSLSNSANATFEFASTTPDVAFECSLNGGPFKASSSPATFTGLPEGNMTLQVRSKDAAGNVSAATSYAWTIDLTPPNTSINTKPSNPTNSTSATFTFSSTTVGATFECSMDNGAFTPRSSPATFTLTDGSHTFRVRARDAAGNADPAPPSYTWTIDTKAPLKPSVTSPEESAIIEIARPVIRGTAEAGSTITVNLNGSKAGTAVTGTDGSWSFTVPTELREGSHTVTVTATDSVGNVSQPSSLVTFIVAFLSGLDLFEQRPICTITLDIPYPLGASDTGLWQTTKLMGTQSVVLSGRAYAKSRAIHWYPDRQADTWLSDTLPAVLSGLKRRRLLARLRVAGRFIRSQRDPMKFLGGAALPANPGSLEVALPSQGDGRRGSDLDLWFWLSFPPRYMARLFVTDHATTHGVRWLSSGDNSVEPVASLPGPQAGGGMAHDHRNGQLVVAQSGTVNVVRLQNHEVVHSLGVQQPGFISYEASRRIVLVAEQSASRVYMFSKNDGGVMTLLRTLDGSDISSTPACVVYEPLSQRALLGVETLTLNGKAVAGGGLMVFEGANGGRMKVLASPDLGLGAISGLAVDSERGELYVADKVKNAISVYSLSTIYETTAAAAPVRQIQGAATLLSGPISLSIDQGRRELWVGIQGVKRVLLYPLGVGGNIAPLDWIDLQVTPKGVTI